MSFGFQNLDFKLDFAIKMTHELNSGQNHNFICPLIFDHLYQCRPSIRESSVKEDFVFGLIIKTLQQKSLKKQKRNETVL